MYFSDENFDSRVVVFRRKCIFMIAAFSSTMRCARRPACEDMSACERRCFMVMSRECTNEIGFGLGLRPEHYEEIAASPGRVSWFEALSENYMVPGGSPLHWLDRIRRDYPMALHGVSLSIGSIDPL